MIKINTIECYRDIQDKYYITTCGKVVIVNKGSFQIMKSFVNKKGYHQYALRTKCGDRKRVLPYAHKLVALAYIRNDDINKTQVDHLDMNKDHNYIGNLEWVTNLENMKRRNSKCWYANSNLCREDILYIRKNYKIWREGRIWVSNSKDLANRFNVDPKTITNIANRLSFKDIE